MSADAERDARWMRRAVELGARELLAVRPNPPVGAVLVSGERLIAEGYHERCGGPHAERIALDRAGGASRGAELFVSLEPCAHHGRTPPCADAVIAAGVSRVVFGTRDPNPQVAGAGLDRLRAAGVRVDGPVLEPEARALAAPFLSVHERGRPYTVLKWAASLDGKTATRTGRARWISSEPARREVHVLRGLVDAVVIGIGTALADDPLLTAREPPPPGRPAARVVVDSRGRLPPSSALARSAREVPLIHAVGPGVPSVAHAARIELPALPGGRLSLPGLWAELARREIQSVLVEGGAELAAGVLGAQLADAALVYLAPLLVGGTAAPGALGGPGSATLEEAARWTLWECAPLGPDARLLCSASPPWRALRGGSPR